MKTRDEQELDILEQISEILADGLELQQLFGRVMSLFKERMGIERSALVLVNDAKERLETVAGIGLTDAEMAKGWYKMGEGITGRVIATGSSRVIADLSQEPDFLNRTGLSQRMIDGGQISFICIPIKDGSRYAGAISVVKPFVDEQALSRDERLLTIVAGSIAQTLRIHDLVQREKDHLLDENRALRDNLFGKYKFDNIIGSSPVMLDVFKTIGQVASSRATCLVLGETGCGKELIAKAIHYNSPRRDKPFIRINCGALSRELLESELFGHVQGSFTGAIKDRIGRFEAADGGSIFLDEIGSVDPQLQVKLLRVLQEREFERVGDHQTIKVDVRVIAATNVDLEQEVAKGSFREDLYYRLNVVTLLLPPLRSRREDIPRLIDYFLDKFNKENARDLKKISRDVLNTLLRYPWQGNVRELENTIERAVVMSTGDEFTEDLLPLQIKMFAQQGRGSSSDDSVESLAGRLSRMGMQQYQMCEGQVYDLVVNEVEKNLIEAALDHHGGVKTKTADFLGINRNTLNKKVKDFGIGNL